MWAYEYNEKFKKTSNDKGKAKFFSEVFWTKVSPPEYKTSTDFDVVLKMRSKQRSVKFFLFETNVKCEFAPQDGF